MQETTARNISLMCAYKICRVEFRYWGMQTKIEKFIHDVALRKTMVRVHRQAWAWQDEWYGLTIGDIHEIERQTQQALAKKMCGAEGSESYAEDDSTAIWQPIPWATLCSHPPQIQQKFTSTTRNN
ncbi:protein retinal degeneration B-like [Eurosta solidaginis]|uniref:protein retinal degeneration B-like n=1 Tax=Eurosta solidaginis TaxID=178769 RepID=UPI003530A32F